LVRLSHVLDYQIWGTNAAGHHATSVVVHALNAALVFGFLWTLLGAASLTTGERLAMALGVAVVFAIHPLQAESVAWMAGRTQLLCTTFGIGCLWAYVARARRWTVWGLFVLALLCKPMAISFPFVMLAIDYYPLRRHEQLGWGRLLREQAAFVALAVAAGLASLHIATGVGGMMSPVGAVPLSQHVLLMFRSLAFYPFKLVWPTRLSPWYPLRLGLSLHQWPVLLSVLGVGIVTALAVWYARRLPALAACWGAYVVLVLPVSGLMQTTAWAVANRYAYLAMLPLLLLAGGMVIWAWRRGTMVNRLALGCLLACELCFFGLRTRSLTPVWRNEETLWRAVLVRFPDSAEMHCNLGNALQRTGKIEEAIAHFEQALRITPGFAGAHYNLGNVFLQEGKLSDAIGHYEQALRVNPDFANAHYNLGNALARVGRVPEAMGHWEQALRINPDFADAHYNLGVALAQAGRTPEAIEHLQQALRIKPDFALAQNALARLQARQ
jgi:tetratricopeptide (TPR) repeat protein